MSTLSASQVVPPLGLSILLSTSPSHVFVSGETVSGIVILNQAKEKKIKAITLRFRGQAKQWDKKDIPSDDTIHYSCQELLCTTISILAKPFTLRSGVHKWSFQFTFPESTNQVSQPLENGTRRERRYSTDSRYREGDMELPPSFETGHSRSDRGASVEYKLAVKAPGHMRIQDFRLELPFSTIRKHRVPDPTYQKFEQGGLSGTKAYYRIDDDGEPASAFQQIETKPARFKECRDAIAVWIRMGVKVSTVVVVGGRLSVLVSVKKRGPGEKVPVPDLNLRKVSVDLTETIGMRFSSTQLPYRGYGDHDNIVREICLGKKEDLNVLLPNEGELDLCDDLGLELDSDLVGPSFTSFAIRRSYKVKFHFTVNCVGTDIESTIEVPEVTILSPKLAVDEDGDLPQYQV
jgi:hypothetical protein